MCSKCLPVDSTTARPEQGLVGALVLTAVHGLLWAGLLFVLVWIVPGYIQTFEEFALELPAVSQLVIRASIVTTAYWYLLVLAAVVAAAVDFAILWMLGRRRIATQVLVGLIAALVPALLGIVIFLGIWLPLTKLFTELK
jgi:type IV pilus assembly protein PilC